MTGHCFNDLAIFLLLALMLWFHSCHNDKYPHQDIGEAVKQLCGMLSSALSDLTIMRNFLPVFHSE